MERIDLTAELGKSPGYAYVARAEGTIVFTAGAVPVDRTGQLVGRNDLEAQTHAVIENLTTALEAAGAAAVDVIKTTIYVVGEQADLPKVWRVFSKNDIAKAPSTLVGVAHLGYEGQLVEIEAIAVL